MAETTDREAEIGRSSLALSTPGAQLHALTLLKAGGTSPECHLAEKAVIDRTLEQALSPELQRAGILASLHTPGELIGRMESLVIASPAACVPYALALQVTDPKSAAAALFHLVRRAVHDQPSRGRWADLTAGKRRAWEAKKTGELLTELDLALATFGLPAGRLADETSNIVAGADDYEKLLYAEQGIEAAHKAASKQAAGGLKYGQIKAFFPLRAPQSVRKVLAILSEYDTSVYNQNDVRKTFTDICQKLLSPDAFFETAKVFDDPAFEKFSEAHKNELFAAAEGYANSSPWQCFLWSKFHDVEIQSQRAGCKGEVISRLEPTQLGWMHKACMEERNPLLASYGFDALDDATKILAASYLLSIETDPKKIKYPAKWAFLLARSTDFFLYFAQCLVGHAAPGATTEKVWNDMESRAMHVLRLSCGTAESAAESLKSAIAVACEERNATVTLQTKKTGRETRRTLRPLGEGDGEEEESLPEGVLTPGGFSDFIEARVDRLQLTGTIREAFASLGGTTRALHEQIGLIVTDQELLDDGLGGTSAERIFEVEKESPLRPFGITGIRVRRRTEGGIALDVQLEGKTDEGATFPDALRISPGGAVVNRHFLAAARRSLEGIMVNEVLRVACKGLDGGREVSGAELTVVNDFIGYVPPQEEETDDDNTPSPLPPPPPPAAPTAPRAPEGEEVKRAAEWLAENILTLGEWKSAVAEAESRNVCDLSPDISHIGASYRLLQTTLTMEGYNKEIPPGGKHIGYFEGHALSPFVERIYFQPVDQSRAFWEGLKIDPRNFPGVEQQSDMYVARVRVKIGENAYEIFGAVFPETHQVLIFGTNPETVQEGDRLSLALSQLILVGFKVAVQREDDLAHRETDSPDAGVQRGRWATEADRVIMNVSKTSYPAIVMVPGPIKDEHTLVVGKGRSEGENKRRINEGTFDDVLDHGLNTLTKKYGCFLSIIDYLRAFPEKKKRFESDDRKIFKGSSTQLKSEYSQEAIYVPLSVEEIGQVLSMIRLNMNEMEASHLYIRTPATAARNKRLPYLPRTNGSEAPKECVFQEGEFDVPPDAELNVVTIIARNRLRFSTQYPFWLLGENRQPAMDLAASLQDPAGRINLKRRARALLVYEFEDELGVHSFGYRYLSTGKDAQYLLGFTTDVEKVSQAITSAKVENRANKFSDFTDHLAWETRDLERFEAAGIIELRRNSRKQILEILPKKKILRKKIVILDEDIGYQQVEFTPPTLVQLIMHATQQEKDFWRDVYEPAQAAWVAPEAAS